MNRSHYNDGFKKAPWTRTPHTENGDEINLRSVDSMVNLGREYYQDGYTEIFPSDEHRIIMMGYLFRNPDNKFYVVIRVPFSCLARSKYIDQLNSERGRIDFAKVFHEPI